MSLNAKPSAGFTLVEVLIVSLLLVFIGIATFQAMRGTVSAKQDVDLKTELLQESRAVLAIMTRDIGMAYYYVAEDFIWEQPPKPAGAAPDEPPPAPIAPKPRPVTIFQGKANELFFSSKSHQRTFADSPENEMHFIKYQLDGPQLVRGESYRAVSVRDREDKDKDFRAFTVLENVKSFVLQYWDPKSEKWVDQWDTEKPEYKDRLPLAVKLDIEYQPDFDQERTRRKIEPMKISSAIRITDAALRSGAAAPGTNPGSSPNSPNNGGALPPPRFGPQNVPSTSGGGGS